MTSLEFNHTRRHSSDIKVTWTDGHFTTGIERHIDDLRAMFVIDSTHSDFTTGDYVSGILEWKEYQVSNGEGLKKVDPNLSSLSSFLGILGMTGLTAYLGLTEIGDPKAGETIVVSGAAGAVGSIVGQIGKISGCTVVGITGTDEKAELLKSKFKFDSAVNYKTATDLDKAIKTACPKGVDIYFDNE